MDKIHVLPHRPMIKYLLVNYYTNQGSSNLAAGVLKPGVNTFATASGVI